MNQLLAFINKEFMELSRSGKLFILIIISVFFGIMNPAIAKLTPWMMHLFTDSLKDSGIIITEIKVDALTSWAQFFKNAPLVIIIFVIMFSAVLTMEYQKGTLINILTKGLARSKIIIAKSSIMVFIWTICFSLYFGITYIYNSFFWDNSIASYLLLAVFCIYLFGIWLIALIIFTSTLTNNNTSVLLSTGAIVILCYLIGIVPTLTKYMPTQLLSAGSLLASTITLNSILPAMYLTILITIIIFIISIPIFNKKQL